MIKKHKTFLGVIGVMLVLLGMTYTLALAVRPDKTFSVALLGGLPIVIGVLLVAWIWGE